MDKTAAIQEKESELLAAQHYVESPYTQRVLGTMDEQEAACLEGILKTPITDIASFFAHFEAVGHLRAIRHLRFSIHEDVDRVNEELKELKSYG